MEKTPLQPNSKPLVEVKNLSIIGEEVIVKPISFSLYSGRALSIVGETGSGKTLLAQAIAGTLPDGLSVSGEIYLSDEAIHNLPQKAREKLWGTALSILPQEPMRALDPTMRSNKQVFEGYHYIAGLNRFEAQQQTQRGFTQMHLTEAFSKFPFELSGGMAQRVALLAARAGGASFTIADEPTKGLDENRRDDIIKELANLCKQNQSLLTITHDIEVAHQLGGDVFVMKEGELIESGPAEQVLNRPKHDYTKALIAANPKTWSIETQALKTSDPILKVENITKSRNQKQLFKDLCLSLKPGQIIGISGNSGCGKSTLGDILLGQISADTGHYQWQENIKSEQKQKLFQDPSDIFTPHCTLKQSFKDVLNKYQLQYSLLQTFMQKFHLNENLLERYPNQVSGGELQRLAIARVMLLKPAFIFADEPTSRLDMLTQKSVIDTLLELVTEHQLALMIVSHDKHLLHAISNQVIDFEELSINTQT